MDFKKIRGGVYFREQVPRSNTGKLIRSKMGEKMGACLYETGFPVPLATANPIPNCKNGAEGAIVEFLGGNV